MAPKPHSRGYIKHPNLRKFIESFRFEEATRVNLLQIKNVEIKVEGRRFFYELKLRFLG